MGKRKIRKPGAPYKGFRMGVTPKSVISLAALEKPNVLTSLQHSIAQQKLDACTKEVKDEEGNVIETKLLSSEKHKKRLEAIVAKPFNEAKVDAKGNDWEKPVEPTKEEIDKMNKDAVEEGKKGKSRKELEQEGDKDA